RNHPVIGARISKRQLAGLRHVDVHVAPGVGYRDLAAGYARLGIAREVALVVPTFVAAAAIVSATDLVATLPETLVRVLGQALATRAVATPVRPPTVNVKLCWHERPDRDPALRVFRDIVARSVAQISVS